MATAEMTIQKKAKQGQTSQAGISLLEMLISLGIFAVIILPLVSMPIKAKEQNNTTLNTNKLSASITEALNRTLSRDVNNATNFLPFTSLNISYPTGVATDYQLVADNTHMFFVAYPNSTGVGDTYVAYRIFKKQDLTDFGDVTGAAATQNAVSPSGRKVPPTSTNYKIQRLESRTPFDLSDTSKLTDASASSRWVTLGGNSTAKALNFGPIKFMYFQNGSCTTSPQKADTVLLVSNDAVCNGATPSFDITVGNTTIKQDPIYYKLGSQQANLDSTSKIYAAPVLLKSYADMSTGLTLNTDIAYDYLNNEILIATNDTAAQKNFYINKCAPESGCSALTFTDAAGDKYFPIILTPASLGHPGNAYNFKSITEDNDGNVYVLAKDTTSATKSAKILKFTSKGVFDNTFSIDSNAIAITFDPSTPDELLVVNQSGSPLKTFIYSYLTDPTEPDTVTVNPTASADVSGVLVDSNNAPVTVSAFDLDPYSNRLILMDTLGRVFVLPHSINSDLGTRVFKLNTAYNADTATIPAITNYYGIAFDPINNRYFTAVTSGGTAKLVSVGNSIRFNRTYQ